MSIGFEQNIDVHSRDWEAVGGYISAAMHEVATDLGGAELAERVASMSRPDSILPSPDALRLLEDIQEGSAERVIFRSGEIQTETHQRELAGAKHIGFRKLGGAILDGFASLNIFGSPPRKSQ